MTSKLSFRARALDASKPMAIYNQEDLPELADIPAINRAVPALPTGMEKEEESEKHLQDILKATETNNDMVIPTPEVFEADMETIYDDLYKGEFKVGRQYIHVQPFANDHDLPDYDLDSEDETYFNDVLKKRFDEFNELQFEDMIDRLEKNSGHQIVSSRDAKLLLSQDDDLIFAVYDYWVNKRLRLKTPLMPTIKSAEISSSSSGNAASSTTASSSSSSSGGNNNPYVCFRRRTEKMQTRKNRKNDESSYEKMLKLRRDLNRTVTLLEMVRRREKMKKENLEFGADIFEKRYQAGDYDGKIIGEIMAGQKASMRTTVLQPTATSNPFTDDWVVNRMMDDLSSSSSSSSHLHHLNNHHHHSNPLSASTGRKRPYKKRKNKTRLPGYPIGSNGAINSNNGGNVVVGATSTSSSSTSLPNNKNNGPEFGTSVTSEDDNSEMEEDEFESHFAFRRKRGCKYYSPIEPSTTMWPWEREAKYRYSLSSLSNPKPRCIGLIRRRIGRGGRVILDRAYTDYDDLWTSMDFTISDNLGDTGVHFRPVTPPHCRDEDWDPYKSRLSEIPSIQLKPLPFLTAQAALAARNNSTDSIRQKATPSSSSSTSSGTIKTVSVDPMSALNAAGALVSNNVIEMFDNKN